MIINNIWMQLIIFQQYQMKDVMKKEKNTI
jgi:hypothetical protein